MSRKPYKYTPPKYKVVSRYYIMELKGPYGWQCAEFDYQRGYESEVDARIVLMRHLESADNWDGPYFIMAGLETVVDRD